MVMVIVVRLWGVLVVVESYPRVLCRYWGECAMMIIFLISSCLRCDIIIIEPSFWLKWLICTLGIAWGVVLWLERYWAWLIMMWITHWLSLVESMRHLEAFMILLWWCWWLIVRMTLHRSLHFLSCSDLLLDGILNSFASFCIEDRFNPDGRFLVAWVQGVKFIHW